MVCAICVASYAANKCPLRCNITSMQQIVTLKMNHESKTLSPNLSEAVNRYVSPVYLLMELISTFYSGQKLLITGSANVSKRKIAGSETGNRDLL